MTRALLDSLAIEPLLKPLLVPHAVLPDRLCLAQGPVFFVLVVVDCAVQVHEAGVAAPVIGGLGASSPHSNWELRIRLPCVVRVVLLGLGGAGEGFHEGRLLWKKIIKRIDCSCLILNRNGDGTSKSMIKILNMSHFAAKLPASG